MREYKYGVGVIAPIFLLNLLLVKMSEKSLTRADFWSKKPKRYVPRRYILFAIHVSKQVKPGFTNYQPQPSTLGPEVK